VKAPGAEPLPGYRLIEPLGRGGFGEVWKCEAPGGLFKAVKFVSDTDHGTGQQLLQEFEAFQRIKEVRHPFVLTLERVERIEDDLIMIMELADEQLHDRYTRYRAEGRTGIPREELLGFLADAAEALDVIAAKHGLQHLDVKPANLFVVGGHVKVGDFGLVGLVTNNSRKMGGLTPRYVAPEVIDGNLHPRSDQYSLALVYQELMTGIFPYKGKSVQQMLLQHAAGEPDLSPLPESDRPVVARALAKDPENRYPGCLAFVHALLTVPDGPTLPTGLVLRTVRAMNGSGAFGAVTRVAPSLPSDRTTAVQTTPPPTVLSVTPLQTPMPLMGQRRSPAPEPPPLDPDVVQLIAHTPLDTPPNKLPRIYPIIPQNWLSEHSRVKVNVPSAADYVESIAFHANGGRDPKELAYPQRRGDGSWFLRFPIRQIAGVARLKMEVLAEEWNADLKSPDPAVFMARQYTDSPKAWTRTTGKRSGIEVVLRLPDPNRVTGQVEATGGLFGEHTPEGARTARGNLIRMLNELRKHMQNVEERRQAIRVPTDMPVRIFPVGKDGVYEPAVDARCRDVSTGGLCCVTRSSLGTSYVYAVFPTVPAVSEYAVLTRITRSAPEVDGTLLAGRFRTDI
jgi:eukaryotic-like serine/threonine-protein kinase